jgi:uncharacterized protein YbjT (DUF2867 family)
VRIAVAGGSGLVGRHVVEAAQARGDQVIVLSRSHGVDLRSGSGLDRAIDSVEAIVDVTNPSSAERHAAAAFFTDTVGQLQRVAAERGVKHLVSLSIVGIERAPNNAYYAAKLHQERITLAGPLPATVVRATQFHEFAVQTLRRNLSEGLARVPAMRVQPIAARSVGQLLVETAEQPARGMAVDLAGPAQADLPDMARAFVTHFGLHITVSSLPPDATVPFGATLPGGGARVEGPRFEQWLESDDATRLAAELRSDRKEQA